MTITEDRGQRTDTTITKSKRRQKPERGERKYNNAIEERGKTMTTREVTGERTDDDDNKRRESEDGNNNNKQGESKDSNDNKTEERGKTMRRQRREKDDDEMPRGIIETPENDIFLSGSLFACTDGGCSFSFHHCTDKLIVVLFVLPLFLCFYSPCVLHFFFTPHM